MKNLVQNQNSEIHDIIEEIIKGINLCETVVFCGAGISRDSGLPIVNQLVPYILKKLELPLEDIQLILDKDNSPKIPFEAFMECIQENSKPGVIFDIYEQGVPNTSHILLAKLLKTGKLKTIVTTNFDKLIERALSMEPNVFIEGIDYDLIFKDKDLESIDWNNDRIRIIKIHGSIDDRESMAITLKQVANQVLSRARFAVIENVFSNGYHKNVLVLGYSSSDIFDLSPQIQAISENHKKVFYVQHADISKVEDIRELQEKNTFKKFNVSRRLYYDTRELIKKIWKSDIINYGPYEQKTSKINWKENVNNWYSQTILESSKVSMYLITINIFGKMGKFKTYLKYSEQALKIAKEIGDKHMELLCLISIGHIYGNLGENRKAIEYLEQSLKISKEIGVKYGEGMSLGSIGNVYHSLSEYRKAIEHYEEALKIAKEIVDKKAEGTWLDHLGVVHNSLGEYRKAVEYLEQALKIAKEIGDKQGEGSRLGNLGNANSSLGES